MNIHWGRGAFRVWLVASVLWVGLASFTELRPFDSVAAPPFDPNKPYVVVPTPATNVFDQFDAPVRPSNLAVAETIVGPPMLVLIAGLALWWVLLGFRPARP